MKEGRYIPEATLEAIARKAIKDYDPSLLIGQPRPIPVDKMNEEQYGLEIEYQVIRKDGRVLGATVFEDDYVPVFIEEIGKYNLVFFKKGTIILDASLLRCRDDGRLRFTMAHELAHWLIHKELYSGSGCVASMVKNIRKSSEADPAVEWQADKLSRCILMPTGILKMAFYRCGGTISDKTAVLAEQFCVSKKAMEIKLKDHRLI